MKPSRQRAAFTLVELVIAMTIMTILVGGMASAVLLATQALPGEADASNRSQEAIEAVEQIGRDVELAVSLVRTDADAIEFTVPDRGHGVSGDETIIYQWSGVPGDPLTYSYNSSAAITLCEDVQELSLEYVIATMPLTNTPRVLLIVKDADFMPSAQDLAREEMIQRWGFSVRMISAFYHSFYVDDQIDDYDVIYISETVWSPDVESINANLSVGVVIEEGYLYDNFGFSQGFHSNYSNDEIWVTDDSHEITRDLGIGATPIFDYYQRHVYAYGTLAPGAKVLSQWPGYEPTTVVLDAGGKLYGGGIANARRVALPWGSDNFEITGLAENGQLLMQRAIEWAAAPVAVEGVKITLQLGSDPSGRATTQVQLLNLPE